MVNKMTYIHDNRTGEIRTITEFEDYVWENNIDGDWEENFCDYLKKYWNAAEIFSFDEVMAMQVMDEFCKSVMEEIMTGKNENFSVVEIS